jgi:DNA-binding CsgD family transcriptional regulator
MKDKEEALREKIDAKIKTIAAIADELPGVIIIHNIETQRAEYMSQRGLASLDLTIEQLKSLSSEEYHAAYFNAEDANDYVPKLYDLLKENDDQRIISFFQQVCPSENEDYTWHFSTIKILMWDDEENPLLIITMAYPVDTKHHLTSKIARLLEENNFLRKNLQKFDQLTRREKEILKLTALGKSSSEMAENLHISQNTAETHRRNIKKKLKAESIYDLSMYARSFDLI